MSIRAIVLSFAVLLTHLEAPAVRAQSGAFFLLAPFGARAVGQAQSVAADTALGTEAIWWNAAAGAWMPKRELAVHHSQTFIATSDMLVFAAPSRRLGTLAGSAYLVNYGDIPVTVGPDGSIGLATSRNYQFALSYAATMGSRFSAGLAYKLVLLRFQCNGDCRSFTVESGSTSALDLGAQYRVPTTIPVVVGASLRNLGPALQIKDKEQADPLPRILQIGARARIPISALARNESTLDVTVDTRHSAAIDGLAGGVAAVLGYRDEFFLRGGYIVQPGEGSGPSIGIGATRGSLTLDLARRFDRLSREIGDSPTYVSLRVNF